VCETRRFRFSTETGKISENFPIPSVFSQVAPIGLTEPPNCLWLSTLAALSMVKSTSKMATLNHSIRVHRLHLDLYYVVGDRDNGLETIG
jgi:hypothetical protein